MSVQLAMLVATAVLAVVAVVAAAVALRALGEAKQLGGSSPDLDIPPRSSAALDHRMEPEASLEVEPEPVPTAEVVRVVEGRVIVQPTHDQIVAATMTRPSVRLNILVGGIAHALRPESRDRILGLMRREYRARRRARQRAARAAARATHGPPPTSGGQGWVGS